MVLPTLLYVAAFFWFYLALPGVGMGVWPQSELVNIALHVTAALGTGWLLVRLSRGGLGASRAGRVMAHPLVLLPLAIGAWSIIVMPVMHLPIRHLLGAPQSGEGIASWLDIATLNAVALHLMRSAPWRWIVAVGATLGFFACLTLHVLVAKVDPTLPMPYDFGDYLAWAALAVWAIWARHPWAWPIRIALALLMTGIQFWLDNKSAIAFSFVLFPFLAMAHVFLTHRSKIALYRPRIYASFNVMIIFGVAVMLVALLFLTDSHHAYDQLRDWGMLWTVLSRAHLIAMGLGPLVEEPLRIMTGVGWGTYTEQLMAHLPLDWVDVTRATGQWDGVSWDHFHTHSLYAETLMSIGLPGLLLLMLYTAGLPLWTRRKYLGVGAILSAGVVTIGSFWFVFVVSLPFLSLAFASVARPVIWLRWRRAWLIGVLGAVMIVQLWAIGASWTIMRNFHEFDRAPAMNTIDQCNRVTSDAGAGGLTLARILTGYLRQFLDEAADKTQKTNVPNHILRLHDLMCQARLYRTAAHGRVSLRLEHAILAGRGETLLGLNDYLTPDARAWYAQGWEDDLRTWLTHAPRRTDMAVPYLSYQLTHGHDSDVRAMTDFILTHRPADPVGLWFRGSVKLNDPAQASAGLQDLRAGLDNGIERFLPIDPALVAQIRGSGPPAAPAP